MKKYVKSDIFKDIPEDDVERSSLSFEEKITKAIYSVVEEYADIDSLNSKQKVILANSIDGILEQLYPMLFLVCREQSNTRSSYL